MFLTPSPGVANNTIATGAPRLPWGPIALVVLALLALFGLYLPTVKSIVATWNSSDTFAHGYVILPISLWLVWRRRANFIAYPPQPYWPALLLLAGAGAAWMAGRLGEVQVVQQYAFAAMIPAIALALFGTRLAGSLAFPLLFVLFAVPFGEIFVAPLIEFTANFTVWAVQMTGIPVLRNGTRFELPTGSWSVVEACSGVRYLISSVTLGCLYAYLTYRSTARRLMFVGLSVVVPVIANGLRAYMIVMIGHTSGMALATGVDHLIYGWLFFGLVMFIMFWIGSYWREDAEVAPAPRRTAGGKGTPAGTARLRTVTIAVIALAALWPAFARYSDRANHNPAPVVLGQVESAWPAAASFPDWRISYMEPDARAGGAFAAPGSARTVRLSMLYYRNQDKDKALVSSLNRLAGYKDAWNETASSVRTEQAGGRTLALRESTLHSPAGNLLVWHWMWIDGRYTASNVTGKLYQAQAKLLAHGDDSALLVIAAPADDNPDAARADLRAFLEAHFTRIDAALQAAHHN
ncbi:MAG: exosortase A [Massilia sp.]